MKCIYCNKPFKPRVRNQKTCGGEECKKQLNRDLVKAYRKGKMAAEVEKPVTTVKKAGVCKGCKYYLRFQGNNICDYASQTGRCRLLVEKENGGYRTDMCVCFEK